MTERDANSIGRRSNRLALEQRRWAAAQRWAIRGSRLLADPIELPSNKAAPLHGLGSATLSRRNPLEYDDEYEDD